MAQDKITGGDIRIDSKFLRWLDNYWYHYKWHTIIGAFAVIVLAIMISQFATQEEYDLTLLYAGPYEFGSEEIDGVMAAAGTVLPSDVNGDGERTTELVMLGIMSAEQMTAYKEEHPNAVINTYLISQELQKFDNLTLAGEYSVMLLDPYLYARIREADGFMPLSEVFGELPECAADEYSVRLCDTGMGAAFEVFGGLPEDTLVCLRRKSTLTAFMSQKSAESRYEAYTEFFKAIVNYK